MPYCSVKLCGRNSKSYTAKDGISFHKFPENPDIKKKWIDATQRENWFPTKSNTICSRHFTPDCFVSLMKNKRRRLLDFAVPTQFLPIVTSSHDTFDSTESPIHSQQNIQPSPPESSIEVTEELPEFEELTPQERVLKRHIDLLMYTLQQKKKEVKSLSDKNRNLRKKYAKLELKGSVENQKIIHVLNLFFNAPFHILPPLEDPQLSSTPNTKHSVPDSEVLLAAPESPNQPKINSQPKKKTNDPFKEYASDSTDDENTHIKEEASDAENSDDVETEDGTPKTEKVFVKSISCKGKQSIDGRSQPKRSRLDSEENVTAYEEELYEFGKYVAEQLLCLDVADARVARMDIAAVLSQFAPKRIREPSTFKEKKIPAKTVAQPVTSMSHVQVATQPQFAIVNTAGPSIAPMNISEPSVTQQVNIPGSAASQTAQVNIRPLETQTIAAPVLTQYAVMNVNQVSKPGAPFGYVVVPAAGPRFGTGQQENTVATSVTTRTISSVDSITTQSSNLASAVPSMTQTSSSMEFDEVAVKIEPESEDAAQSTYSHAIVFESEEQESVVIKYEKQSDDET